MGPTVALLGGTGHEGRAIALRLAVAGHAIVIGSRSAERAAAAAGAIRARLPAARVRGATNAEAAAAGEIVFVTLPLAGVERICAEVRERLAGKVVVEVVNPLAVVDGVFTIVAPPEGSAAEHVRARLPDVRLVSALKTVSAGVLERIDAPLGGDVLVCGDDPGAKDVVRELLGTMGARVVDAGPLALSRHVEHVTALLLNLNRRFGALTSVAIVGLPAATRPPRR